MAVAEVSVIPIELGFEICKVTAVPLKVIMVAELPKVVVLGMKLVPFTVKELPPVMGPAFVANETSLRLTILVMVGVVTYQNRELADKPPAVETVTGANPMIPEGVLAVILLLFWTLILVTARPLRVAVAPVM